MNVCLHRDVKVQERPEAVPSIQRVLVTRYKQFHFVLTLPVAYAQIDWHGFVVVETVDFQTGEQGNFPPPLRPEDIGKRILAEKRYEQFGVSSSFPFSCDITLIYKSSGPPV